MNRIFFFWEQDVDLFIVIVLMAYYVWRDLWVEAQTRKLLGAHNQNTMLQLCKLKRGQLQLCKLKQETGKRTQKLEGTKKQRKMLVN